MLSTESKVDISPFFDAITDIPDKNRGGCLFFCYAFWKWLKKHGHETETFQISQYDENQRADIDSNLEWINGNADNPTSSYHFSWWYQDNHYDAEGAVDDSIYSDLDSEVLYGLNTSRCCLVEEFCREALLYSGWNDRFCRKLAIHTIKETLDIDLGDVMRNFDRS